MFEDMNKKITMLFQWTFTTNNFKEFFNAYEMEERNDQFVDLTIGVYNMLATMWTIPTLFKNLTKFLLANFDELVFLVKCQLYDLESCQLKACRFNF